MEHKRLKKLIRYRKRLEDQRKRSLASAVERLVACQNEKQQYELRLNEEKQSMASLAGELVPAEELVRRHDYLKRLDYDISQIEERLLEYEREVEGRRREVVKAHRAVRALEILARRQSLRAENSERKREQAQLDVLSAHKHVMGDRH